MSSQLLQALVGHLMVVQEDVEGDFPVTQDIIKGA